MIVHFLFLTLIPVGVLGPSAPLNTVSDDDLLMSLRVEDYVVVLFSKKDCKECDVIEQELIKIKDDLDENLSALMVKVYKSQLISLYSPKKEPCLVFFRHGIPLLYEGEPKGDSIFHYFVDNKQPVVRELSDDNFESLTQAASGATTGDWFVLFYSQDCAECQHLIARWEAVGAKLKTRMNIARINRKTMGKNTARRFSVTDSPTFLFFRLGRMYRYNIPKYDVPSFVSFATDWYKNAPVSQVPLPKTPFDNLTQFIADYVKENPWLWKLGSASAFIGVILSVLIRLRFKEEVKPKNEESKPISEKEKAKKSK